MASAGLLTSDQLIRRYCFSVFFRYPHGSLQRFNASPDGPRTSAKTPARSCIHPNSSPVLVRPTTKAELESHVAYESSVVQRTTTPTSRLQSLARLLLSHYPLPLLHERRLPTSERGGRFTSLQVPVLKVLPTCAMTIAVACSAPRCPGPGHHSYTLKHFCPSIRPFSTART